MKPAFSDEELLALIASKGDRLFLCLPGRVVPADPTMNIPGRVEMEEREIPGYLAKASRRELGVAHGEPQGIGNQRAFVACSAISKEELQRGDVRLKVNGTEYQITYVFEHIDAGVPRLHEVELLA